MKTTKWQRWLVFAVVAIAQLVLINGYRSGYEDVAQNGTRYTMPVRLYYDGDADYLRVFVSSWEARWLNANPPERGERVYVSVAPDAEGRLMIKGADLAMPAQGDYLTTEAWSNLRDGTVELKLPFERYYLDKHKLQQLPLDEYMAEDEVDVGEALTPEEKEKGVSPVKYVPRHELLAVLRVLEGDAVITDILVDGRSIGEVYPTGDVAGTMTAKVPATAPTRKGGA